MASFKQTLKDCLLGYPTIFPNPVNVCTHLFAVIGNGYEWHNGELVSGYKEEDELNRTEMKYPKPREYGPDYEGLERLHMEWRLKEAAERVQMKFVEDNIHSIIELSPIAEYFGEGRESVWLTEHICTEYADGLDFPDDIKPDWAEALYAFLNYWLIQIGTKYKDQIPADVQEAVEIIQAARDRLHPLAHEGQSYEEYIKQHSMIWNSIKDLMAP